MSELLEHFLKTRVAPPFQSVFKAKRKYAPFVATLFLIQLLLFSLCFSFGNMLTLERASAERDYDYHVALYGLDETQFIAVRDYAAKTTSNSDVYTLQDYTEHTSSLSGEHRFDAYITLNTGNKNYGFMGLFKDDSLQANYDAFTYYYEDILFGDSSTVSVSFSPLFHLGERQLTIRLQWTAMLLLAAGLSYMMLHSIFSTKLNDESFQLGIYATFGANFKRLRSISLWETVACASLSLIPAFFISLFAVAMIYAVIGQGFSLSLSSVLLPFAVLIAVMLLAVYVSMRRIIQRDAIDLLAAADNANLVSPVRKSANMSRRRFTLGYERLTVYRFRRYFATLALVSSLLSALFICGFYVKDLYRQQLADTETVEYDYSVVFNEDFVSSEALNIFASVEGITAVHRSFGETAAEDLNSHLLVHKQDVMSAGFLTPPSDNRYRATNSIRYQCAVDENVIAQLTERYTVTGDPDAVLTDPHSIIIGARGTDNHVAFALEPGDTVLLGVMREYGEEETVPSITDPVYGDELLRQQLERFDYVYTEYTVAAVIEDYPAALDGIPVIMNADAYCSLTGESLHSNTLYIRTDDTLLGESRSMLEGKIRNMAFIYNDAEVTATDADFEARVLSVRRYDALMVFVAILCLLFVPIVWFFTQWLFYRRRFGELSVLRAIGATPTAIRKLHFQSGIVMLPVALLSLLLSAFCVLAVWELFQYVFPSLLGIGAITVSTFRLNAPVFAICLLVTVSCSVLSALLPYISYVRRYRENPLP